MTYDVQAETAFKTQAIDLRKLNGRSASTLLDAHMTCICCGQPV